MSSDPRTVARLEAALEKQAPGLAAYVLVPASAVSAWDLAGTTTITATFDGVPLGRRSLHRLDDERWFVELTKPQLAATGKGVGDRGTLELALAGEDLPTELVALIEGDGKDAWERLTDAQRRMLREEVLAAKTSATRERRARRALVPAARPQVERVDGLGEPVDVTLRIVGRELPGTTCGPYAEVRVGMPQRVGAGPDDTVAADVAEVVWETRLQVRDKDGRPAFRGPAVNGPPDQRFVYLTWIGRLDGGHPAMFRRAKIRLDAVPPAVLAEALRSGTLTATVGLTDAGGMPRCASVLPPVAAWRA